MSNTTDLWWNSTNSTSTLIHPWRTNLKIAYKVLLPTILVLIMVAMGCNVSVTEVWKHVKRPYGFGIGAVGQFVLLPLLAFTMAHVLSLAPGHAIGLIIVSTCPGGAVSNIFTHWVRGDISLSISMTTVATVLSFGTMPLNLWIYTRSWTSDTARIPYVNIVITLASILGPAIVGMVIQRCSQRAGKIITTVGSISGVLIIWAAIIIQVILYPEMLKSGWRVIFASSMMPIAGFSASYVVALLFKRSAKVCRTIGIETGCQNVVMAISIIALSFSDEMSAAMTIPCLIYGTFVFVECFIFVGVFQLVSRRQDRRRKMDNKTYEHAPEPDDPVRAHYDE